MKTILSILILSALSAIAQPLPPTIVLRQTNGSVTASWSAVNDPNVATYVVWWGTAARVYNTNFATTNLSQQIFGLAPGTYYFAVTARTRSGIDSDFSVEATNTIYKTAAPATINTTAIKAAIESAPFPEGPWTERVVFPEQVFLAQNDQRFFRIRANATHSTPVNP